jgi:hypothetical protein
MKWHIYRINCDCAAFFDARRRQPDPYKFMRCRLCGKKLGDMQVQFKETVEAETESEAISKVRSHLRRREESVDIKTSEP